jgi:16S rRNA G966 N2-methylase RsmD
MIQNIELSDSNNKKEIFKYHNHFDMFKNMKPWLHIKEDEWTWIKENIEEDVVKDSLTVLLSEYTFPYKRLTIDDAKEDFLKLIDLDSDKMTNNGKWFSRSNINKPLTELILSGSNVGNKASDFFQQEWRMRTELENSPSQWRVWNTPKFMRTLINSFYSLKLKEISDSSVRTALSLRKGVASQFKPSVAKWIYDTYKAENILDFSAGWGDRLCGFYASKTGKNFLGLDPNPNVHIGYEKQIAFYNTLTNNKKAKTIITGAETVDLTNYKDKFDLIFTSPPYFNREKYTSDDTQSWVKYRAIEDWLEHFLFKTISNLEPALKSGGILAINISDVCSTSRGRKEKGWLEICNPMLDYVESLNKFKLEKIVGYKMAKKPGSQKDNPDALSDSQTSNLSFGEPLFIWRKN